MHAEDSGVSEFRGVVGVAECFDTDGFVVVCWNGIRFTWHKSYGMQLDICYMGYQYIVDFGNITFVAASRFNVAHKDVLLFIVKRLGLFVRKVVFLSASSRVTIPELKHIYTVLSLLPDVDIDNTELSYAQLEDVPICLV